MDRRGKAHPAFTPSQEELSQEFNFSELKFNEKSNFGDLKSSFSIILRVIYYSVCI